MTRTIEGVDSINVCSGKHVIMQSGGARPMTDCVEPQTVDFGVRVIKFIDALLHLHKQISGMLKCVSRECRWCDQLFFFCQATLSMGVGSTSWYEKKLSFILIMLNALLPCFSSLVCY